MKKSTGKQIKNFAGLLCVLGCAFSLLGGILFFASDQVFIGLCVILSGCYVSWASTRCLKGFGELVEDTAANLEINEQILDVLESMYTRELEADAVKRSATPPSSESVFIKESKPVFVEKTYPRSTTQTVKKYNPLLNGLVISVIILFVLIIVGVASSSTAKPAATAKPTKKIVVTAVPTKTPYISATPKRTTKATVKPTATATATPTEAPTSTPTATPTKAPTSTPTATPTNTPAPTPEETAFIVEHDEEYYATQDYIHKFLTEKGYEVRTFIGVPDIGRIEDSDPDDKTVPWYAFVMHKGKWTQFNILLFNGEVSFIRPVQ